MKTNRQNILLCLMAILSLSACKKGSDITVSRPSSAYEEARYKTLVDNQLQFDNFQSKVSIRYNDGQKNMSVNGTLKLIKDQQLQISIQPFLGIELFRAEFSTDSVKVVDRINKQYVAEDISVYMHSLPVDVRFETLQALFMNYLFVPGNEVLQLENFSLFTWKGESNQDLMARVRNQNLFDLTFYINPENYLKQTMLSNKANTHQVEWNYSAFMPLGNSFFPTNTQLVYRGGSKVLSAEIVYSKPEINKSINMQFAISPSYKRLQLPDLINSIMK